MAESRDPGEIARLALAAQQRLNEGGPGPTHERLKADLVKWAKSKGFSTKYAFDGMIPDVLLKDGELLFLGDAKDSENETATTDATVQEIKKYLARFASLLQKGTFTGGYVAIATDSRQKADKWVTVLADLCTKAGIKNENKATQFRIELMQDKSFVIWWKKG